MTDPAMAAFAPETHASRLLAEALGKLTPQDRTLARLLASIEFFGEPDAMGIRSTPAWALFLACNLRDPANRAAVVAALGHG